MSDEALHILLLTVSRQLSQYRAASSSLGASTGELHLTFFPQGNTASERLVRTTKLTTLIPAFIASGMLVFVRRTKIFENFGL